MDHIPESTLYQICSKMYSLAKYLFLVHCMGYTVQCTSLQNAQKSAPEMIELPWREIENICQDNL